MFLFYMIWKVVIPLVMLNSFTLYLDNFIRAYYCFLGQAEP